MAFVQFSKVSLAFVDRNILKDVSLNLSAGSRAALMKVIAGVIAADSGDRAVQKGCRVSYLPQSGIVHSGRTLRDEAELAYAPIAALLSRMEDLGRELETAKADGSRTALLLDEYHRLGEEVERSGYYEREQQIALVLEGLGFSGGDRHRRVEEFSGGWQMRVALAKVVLESPEILLLDEPTNYLDIEARAWLEEWLQKFSGGYLLVSHDRYFLDVTVNEVYELFQGSFKRYAGNYTAYETVRQAEIETLVKRYEEQQEEIAKSEDLIRRFRYKASKAAMVQERIKKLDKMERIVIPESLKKMSIRFPVPPHAGRIALTIASLGKSYGSRRIFSGLDLVVESGEKLVVVGRNGAGKTTLLRILAGGDSDFEGGAQFGAGIVAGYFSQDAAESFTTPVSALEYLEAEAPLALIPKVRDMLGAFLFRGDDVYKSVSVLSGGEKSRLALLKLLLKPLNLLILDEPTNHLDLQSKDILLDTLKTFAGTVIFVSHDRSFMEGLSTKTLEISDKGPRLFYGNYAYYLEKMAAEEGERGKSGWGRDSEAGGLSLRGSSSLQPPRPALPVGGAGSAETAGAAQRTFPNTSATVTPFPTAIPTPALFPSAASSPFPEQTAAQSGKERREAEKQRQAAIRRLQKQEAEILSRIAELEAEKARLEAELAKPEVYSNGEKAKQVKAKLDGIAVEIEDKTAEWEAKAAELGENTWADKG